MSSPVQAQPNASSSSKIPTDSLIVFGVILVLLFLTVIRKPVSAASGQIVSHAQIQAAEEDISHDAAVAQQGQDPVFVVAGAATALAKLKMLQSLVPAQPLSQMVKFDILAVNRTLENTLSTSMKRLAMQNPQYTYQSDYNARLHALQHPPVLAQDN